MASIRYNPLVILTLIDVLSFIAICFVNKTVIIDSWVFVAHRYFNYSLIIFCFLFFVFRNVLLVYIGIDMIGDFSK